MARVLLFDVNETLLDMSALDPQFERIFGKASLRESWFQELKESWLVALVTNQFTPFADLARAALRMTAEKEGVALTREGEDTVVSGMKELPPHPECSKALHRLRDAGFSLAALTNSGPAAAQAQLDHAGLADNFEAIMSAEEVKRFKPASEPYHMAAERFGVAPNGTRLVAAHAWDIAGAAAAGCTTGFVARARQVLNPVGAMPDLVGSDLLELADRILNAE